MKSNPLGNKTEYKPYYDKSLLFPIKRDVNRANAQIDSTVFTGYDIWNCYELSYLNRNGVPQVRKCRIVYPSDSVCIVESKSLKLYLGSFIMTQFDGDESVQKIIQTDLQEILLSSFVKVELFDYIATGVIYPIPSNQLLDNLDVVCDVYTVDSSLLSCKKHEESAVYSHWTNLLKTNCPITGQPDWATVQIEYKGVFEVIPQSLLKYIISYREHGDYHETCCEKIFTDLFTILNPEYLFVKCFFTRRGGIDINPCRFYGIGSDGIFNEKHWRQ
ncbi:MAG: hypothetical protein A2015_08180 [Spirochaetes bacterium GWF1_31_7]|nr:MAG: hypothetical protein A2Y30_02270 [Spirochaetes bacterium GWE1_32_154]OHD47017.1 MAG: hypothetical protein A2015_08180 [Spirochaetes bacterium GWF1_31_7]OHD49794.1 MAG: hypothetical protein A2Y29_06380 [Spirochaetes bacterium GWE2_31_10]HBD96259.1 NADPH-dependent 7-cyano-7-deazaguanine reductase QueF [Spirochaetia bacterium]HBI37016.1 NADPH-dependent 7-cyano-7-deazaguanine reductase QueF [Spirochaetia bacterium]